MERFIADLVRSYESGAIDRREFCKSVALAAVVYGAGDAANAQPARGFKVLGINHISYACADYTKARDWYVSVLGMEPTPGKDTGKRVNLMFGPKPGEGGTFMVPRNAEPDNRPPAKAVVDHICWTVSNWNEQQVRSALEAKGLTIGGRPGSLHVYDPNNYDVQIANSVEETAFRR